MNILCIVQARMSSTRLPGKVLKDLCGKSVLAHVINRLKKCKKINEIVVATTLGKEDDDIEDEAKRLGVSCFRGSKDDVLSRYYYAAKSRNADIVIRVTSDCPCIDYKIIDEMINIFEIESISKKIDYFSNTFERTFPRGYDVEVFTFDILEQAHVNAKKEYEREHVTPYMYDSNNGIKIKSYLSKNEDNSNYRVTLDTQEDFVVIKSIFEELYSGDNYFDLKKVVNYLRNHDDIVAINKDIEQKKLGE